MTSPPPDLPAAPPGRDFTRLTALSLIGLAAGIAIGMGLAGREGPLPEAVLGTAAALIRAWTNAFRVLVVPLVVSQLYLTVAGAAAPSRTLGRLSAVALGVFAAMLVVTAGLTCLVVPALMRLAWLSHLTLPAATGAAVAGGGDGSPGSWVDALVPPNLVAAAAGDALLPLMLFALAFAAAARRLDPTLRESLSRVFEATRGATFVLVEWLLAVTPLIVLALGVDAASRSGLAIGEVVLAFMLVEATVLVLAILVLYPVAAVAGPYRPWDLARVVLPAQITAATTRSSLATLPALLEAARALRIPEPVAAYVLPLAGSALKLSRTVSSPAKLIFLATLLALPLDARTVLVFALTIILLSPSELGIPRVTSGPRSMPAYVAAGIPPQYVVLLGAATAVTDVLLTVLNAMGYLTATVLSARLVRGTGGRD